MCDVGYVCAVPILVFLGLSVLELDPTYATDRRQMSDRRQRDRRQTKAWLNVSALWGRTDGRIIMGV